MAKKKAKVKKKCCLKYLKEGKHCKSCPLFADGESCPLLVGEDSGKTDAKPKKKKKADSKTEKIKKKDKKEKKEKKEKKKKK